MFYIFFCNFSCLCTHYDIWQNMFCVQFLHKQNSIWHYSNITFGYFYIASTMYANGKFHLKRSWTAEEILFIVQDCKIFKPHFCFIHQSVSSKIICSYVGHWWKTINSKVLSHYTVISLHWSRINKILTFRYITQWQFNIRLL